MAELRLDVTLNLAGFRAQLEKLATEAGARYFGVKLSIDGTDFKKQLKNLEKIKPVITINDSQLIAARERIGTLNKSLVTLRRATATPIEIKIKYVEVGKPPSGGTAQIGKAVSGGVRGSQAIEGFSRSQLQSTRKAMVGAGMSVGEMGNLAKASTDEYKKSIIQGFTNSGQEAINGLAAGLKDSSSKIAQAASKVGEQGVRGIKDALGIASPSKVFRQIGEFSVDGLELGFLNGLKDFKNKSISEVRTIVALLKLEFAKIKDIGGAGGPTAGSLRQKLVGNRTYSAPIGPQPIGSTTPYARGDRGQFGHTGYEPRMVSRLRGQAPTADSNSFLQFSRNAAQVQPLPGTQGSFRGFSQRATQVQQASGGGGGVPLGGGGGAGGGGGVPPRSGGGGAFSGMQFAMPKLPGTGIVRALGTEFAFAAKQVLLFGAAYKALAFLTDFPSKVGEAVGQLQSFRNTIKAISPTANEAAQSSQFILDVVDKYNVPLQSARDGFTKLYASMQPAGFNGGEIRDLFLGISQAAATFGMSADKVDRVNYAFAQMASKGQIMSEELKGQLGDVLPGAMSIFAEAAGFKGPKAIQDFSKALEDGTYQGGAMKTLLTNVGTLMRKEFGPGAEGAARTFQGSMNRMQNSLKLFYETFEPVAVGFLNAVVMPMTSGIKTLTDGFNAFFTGAATKTSGGFAIAQELEKLRPTFEGLRTNAVELIKVFGALANTVLTVGKLFLQLASNPFVGYIAKIAIIVVPLNAALGGMIGILTVMRGIWAANAIQLLLFNRGLVTGNITLSAFRAQMKATGATAAVTSASIRTAGITLRTFFAATGVGLVLVGISLLIERFLTMNQALADSKEKALGAAQAIRSMSQTEARQAENQASRDIKTLQQLQKRAKKGEPIVKITEEEKTVLKRSGVSTGLFNPDYGKTARLFPEGPLSGLDGKSLGVEVSSLAGALQQADSRAKEAAYRIRAVKFEEQQVLTPPALQAIPGGGGEDDKAAQREEERQAKLQDKLANRDQQLAVDAANRQVALDQSTFDSRLRMSDAEYNHLRALQDDYFEREISGLDSIEARQKKHQQDLKAIENRRIDSIRKAELDAVKAVQDLRSASIKAAAVSGAPGAAKFGDTGRTSNAPGFVHGHVQNMDRGALKGDATSLVKSLLQQGVTPELGSGAQFNRSMSDAQIADLVGRGIAAHKQYASGASAIDIFVPKGTSVPAPLSNVGNLGGAVGVTGTMQGGSQLMHLDPSSKSSSVGLATRSGAFAMGRREDKAEGQLAVEQQDAQNRAVEKLATIRNANNLALQQTITLVKQNIDSIFPLREQQLENDLLELRNNLESKGVSKQMIDMEVEKAKRSKESALAAEVYTKKIDESTAALERYNKMKTLTPEDKSEMARLTAEIDLYKKTLADLPELQGRFNNELARTATLTTDSSFESAMTSLKDRMKMAQAFTPGQELKTQIALDNPDLSPEQQQVLFDTTQATIKLEELREKVKNISQSIGDALGNSLNSGIQGLIAGTANAQQIFSDFLKSMGDILIQEGAKMIATYTAIAIAKALAGLLGGGSSGGLPSFGDGGGFGSFEGGALGTASGGLGGGDFTSFLPSKSFYKANGGPVSSNSTYMVGEKGPELFVPSTAGTIIPADATAAMARYQRQGGGSGGGNSSSDAMGDGAAATPVLSMSFETTRFLGQDYVSTDQLQAAMMATERRAAAAGAKAGAAQVTSKLQQSPNYRRQVGLR